MSPLDGARQPPRVSRKPRIDHTHYPTVVIVPALMFLTALFELWGAQPSDEVDASYVPVSTVCCNM